MDCAFIAVTFAAAALAYVLISHARAYAAARRREAEFFARRLRKGRFGRGELFVSDRPQASAVAAVAYWRMN